MAGKRRGSHGQSESSRLARNGLGRQHTIGHEQVADIQRARMLAAMVEEVAERGAGKDRCATWRCASPTGLPAR